MKLTRVFREEDQVVFSRNLGDDGVTSRAFAVARALSPLAVHLQRRAQARGGNEQQEGDRRCDQVPHLCDQESGHLVIW